MNPMRRMTASLVALSLTACGGGGPTSAGTDPGSGGGPAKCPYNAAILATDPACVAPPVVTPVAIYAANPSSSSAPTPADSSYTTVAAYRPELDVDRRWYVAPVVYVRLSNSDMRPATTYQWIPTDTSALDVRIGPDGFRAKREGCTKVRVQAEGLESWIWVRLDLKGAKCS